MATANLDFNIDDQWASVIAFCERMASVWKARPGIKCEIDLHQADYLGPYGASLLYASYLRAKTLGQQPVMRLPSGPPPLRAFCSFVGLEYAVEGGKQPQRDHPDSETVPLSVNYKAAASLPLPILRLVSRHGGVDAESGDAIKTTVHEAAQNTADHADAPHGAIMSARYLSQRRDLRVAVVDTGIGISGSLAKREKLSDVDAVSKVLEGFSSKSQGHNMGLGIRNITDIVRMFHGELIIISGSAGAVIRGGAKEVQGFEWSYPGTAVMFRMRLDPPEDGKGEDL